MPEDDRDDITVERRKAFERKTVPRQTIDAYLLALARGDLDPEAIQSAPPPSEDGLGELGDLDDPFGGLIPVYDDEPLAMVEDERCLALSLSERATPARAMLSPLAVLALAMTPVELVTLPLDGRAGFLLSLIDGARTVEEIVDASALPGADAGAILEQLVAYGAVRVAALAPAPRGDRR